MGVYGSAIYGLTTYGGTSTSLMWAVDIDWDGSGFDDNSESAWMTYFQVTRGRNRLLSGNGFETQSGSGSVVLINKDGRFDPYNTASPLYPNVEEGKFIRVRIKNLSDVTYALISGVIQSIIPISGRDPKVRIVIDDGWVWLAEPCKTEVFENINTQAAIDHIIDQMAWPARWNRNIGRGKSTPRFWWADADNAGDEIKNIVDSELGVVWIDRDGGINFRRRQEQPAPKMTLDQSQILSEIILSQPWDTKKHAVEVKYNLKSLGDLTDIWTAQEIYTLDPGATQTIYIDFDQPVISIDSITLTANSDGNRSGIDLSADITTVYTATAWRAVVDMTNNAAQRAYIYDLTVNGVPIDDPTSSPARTTVPENVARPRTLKLDLKWLQNRNTAESFAIHYLDYLSTVKPWVTVQIENRPDIQFEPDLYDVITLDIPKLTISGDYQVIEIDHATLTENCQAVLTKLVLEPMINIGNQWIWPVTWPAEFGW